MKENFHGIHFRQIDQNSQNWGNLEPKNFAFYIIDIFKRIF